MPSAVRRTTSSMMARCSWDAVMSRKTSSSAPWASYASAASTGSPASRRSTKRTPLTTRPAWTSRHGMRRLQSMALAGLRHRGAEIHRPAVERAADDDAIDARDGGELADIVQGAHAARGEERDGGGAGHRLRAPQVGAALGAVPRDIRVDDGRRPRRGGVTPQGHCFQLQDAGPAIHGDVAVRGVDPHDDPILEAAADLAEKGGIERRPRAHDGPARPRRARPAHALPPSALLPPPPGSSRRGRSRRSGWPGRVRRRKRRRDPPRAGAKPPPPPTGEPWPRDRRRRPSRTLRDLDAGARTGRGGGRWQE